MKLNSGSAEKRMKGFVNVDIRKKVNPDVVDDIAVLKKFKNNSADLIYVCHVLEHFKRDEYFNVLKRWTEVLKPGGKLRLAVPDFEQVAKLYLTGKYELKTFLGLLYGGQTYEYNFHYMGFDFRSIRKDLKKLGYEKIHIYNWRHTEHADIDDYSQAYIPHLMKDDGQLVSLNIEATKKKNEKQS